MVSLILLVFALALGGVAVYLGRSIWGTYRGWDGFSLDQEEALLGASLGVLSALASYAHFAALYLSNR